MEKILHSDWLRAVLFFLETSAEKSKFSPKRGTKLSILFGQWWKKLTDGQSSTLLSNQAQTLDGAIFPDCMIHMCFFWLTISMIFLVQFGINKSCRLVQFCWSLKNLLVLYLFQIALKIMWLRIQILPVVLVCLFSTLFWEVFSLQDTPVFPSHKNEHLLIWVDLICT